MAVAAAITAAAAAERLPKRKFPIRFTLKFLVTLLAGDCAASSFALLTKARGNLSEFLVTNFNAHLLPALGVIRNLQRVVLPCVICPWSPLASTGKPSTRTTQKKRKERKGAKEAQKLCGKTFAATINFSHVASGLRRQRRQRRQFPITVAKNETPLDIVAASTSRPTLWLSNLTPRPLPSPTTPLPCALLLATWAKLKA